MQQPTISYLDWMQLFSTQAACLAEIARHRWPQGFICPRCGHDHAFVLTRGHLHQCARCRHPVSVSAGTVFHRTHVPLPKGFAALYLMSTNKGGIGSRGSLKSMMPLSEGIARANADVRQVISPLAHCPKVSTRRRFACQLFH